MAKNERLFRGEHVELPTATGLKSGDPIVVGLIVGVLEIDAEAASPFMATVDIHGGVYQFTVKGIGASAANTALTIGGGVYYNVASTPKLSGDPAGTLFGYLLDPVASAATAATGVSVRVKIKTV